MEKEVVQQYYAQYADTVMRAAWHFTGGSAHTAQDCAQEAFLRLLQQEPMPDSKIMPWLLRTAINLARDSTRRFDVSRTVELDEAAEMPTDDADLLTERAAKRAMLSLPEKYRLPLILHYVEGYPLADIGSMLGIPEKLVKSRLHQARKALAGRLEGGEA